ncbi:hypothetical protein GQX74_012586 [Glossina fuscipes]|nr:hypothetical protein GQX74_012586 [Glossina fuscipes]
MYEWDDNADNAPGYNEKPRFTSNRNNARRYPNRTQGMNKRSDDNRRGERENYNNKNKGRDGAIGRHFDFKESLDLRTECIGRIIGRGGSNIQGLQTEFDVQIDLDKSQGIATVLGNDSDSVNGAVERIKQQMNECNDGQRQYNGGTRNRNQFHNDRYNQGHHQYRSEVLDDQVNGANVETPRNGNNFYEENNQGLLFAKDGVIDWTALNARADIERAERWAKCPQLTKNFYKEDPEVTNIGEDEVARIRLENNNITVGRVFTQENDQPGNIPNPIWKFEHCFAPYPDLLDEVAKQGFQTPSPIQTQAWPILLKGEDMIGIAQTGTGKTLAFLLPALIHIEYQSIPRSERGGPNVLILAPTRELALQIEKEVNKYSFRGIKAVCIYGGGSRNDQIQNVERGVEVIICTPGRLNDLVQANVIDVTTVTYLVLDEADRMLDMGFEPQIRKVLLDIRPDRQTIMTSATWPPGVRRLAQSYMSNPIQVCVGSLDLAATHSVRQVVEVVEEDEKFYMFGFTNVHELQIKSFIKNMQPDDKLIVFCGKKVRADDLSSDLTLDGFLCQAIHGSRDQADREQAIADITSGDVKILIATDVASRGLDIDDITHVINFDFPRNIEEYVHRVGRTGRAGRTGTSISYLTRSDWAMAPELIKIMEEANQQVPEELIDMAERYNKMKERRSDEMSKFNGMKGRRGGGGGGNRSYGNRNY